MGNYNRLLPGGDLESIDNGESIGSDALSRLARFATEVGGANLTMAASSELTDDEIKDRVRLEQLRLSAQNLADNEWGRSGNPTMYTQMNSSAVRSETKETQKSYDPLFDGRN